MIKPEFIYVLVPQRPTASPPPAIPSLTLGNNRMPNSRVAVLLVLVSLAAFCFGMATGSVPPTTNSSVVLPSGGPGPILPVAPSTQIPFATK